MGGNATFHPRAVEEGGEVGGGGGVHTSMFKIKKSIKISKGSFMVTTIASQVYLKFQICVNLTQLFTVSSL